MKIHCCDWLTEKRFELWVFVTRVLANGRKGLSSYKRRGRAAGQVPQTHPAVKIPLKHRQSSGFNFQSIKLINQTNPLDKHYSMPNSTREPSQAGEKPNERTG